MSERPTIIISCAHDERSIGDGASNGGIKLYNLWSLLLREHGYESYIATYDGSKIEWLIEHTDYISLDDVRQMQAQGRNLKFMSAWFWSAAFLALTDKFYLFDAELAFTSSYQHQRHLLEQNLAQNRIAKIGTHSRTMQAWYQTSYGITPIYIPEWHADYWMPDEARRVTNRIGFLDEGAHTWRDIDVIKSACAEHNLYPEFLECCGCESEVLSKMQTCDLFIGENMGKDPVFGEGSPRSPGEAMRAGCVLIAYEVFGNAYYLIDGYTGYVEPRGRPDMIAGRVIELLSNPERKEWMRARSIDFARYAMSSDGRWKYVSEFLELPENEI